MGVPIIRTMVFWGLYWGPPVLGNYHIITLDLLPSRSDYSRAAMGSLLRGVVAKNSDDS